MYRYNFIRLLKIISRCLLVASDCFFCRAAWTDRQTWLEGHGRTDGLGEYKCTSWAPFGAKKKSVKKVVNDAIQSHLRHTCF